MPDRFRPSRPAPLAARAVFWATLADAAVAVVFVAVRILTTDWSTYVSSRVHWFVHDGHRMEATPGVVVFTVVLGFVVVLGGAAIRVLLALKIVRGFAWARLVLSILVAIALVSTVWGVATGTMNVGGWADLYGDAFTAVLVAGVSLLWLPGTSRYLAAVKADRARHRETLLR